MVEIQGVTANDDAFYEAIRAQLSIASVRLERRMVQGSRSMTTDPLRGASGLAADHDADMVFWITVEEAVYTIFFYTRHAATGQIQTREMDLASENQLSRSDIVGNAAASFVEEAFSPPRNRPPQATSNPPAQKKPPPPPPARDTNREWIDLSARYAGSLFAHHTATHGVRIGVGLLPTRYIALALSYTQDIPAAWKTGRYRLRLTSRAIEASVAARLVFDVLELRLGLSWSVALRSYSMDTFSAEIAPRPDDLSGIHSIVPFINAIWSLTDLLGIVAGLGANLAVNEKAYLILRSDGSEVHVIEPFFAKLIYQVGVIIQL